MKRALIIGNSDGVGLALTRRLLAAGWRVIGLSRSPSAVTDHGYEHHVIDIRAPEFAPVLRRACADLDAPPDVCVYCAGVGQEIDFEDLSRERPVFEVNLLGAVTTIEVVLPLMLAGGRGHIVGLSSQADQLRDPAAPSYAASKAGLSAYLEGLDKAVRGRGVCVTNVRLGFVDTKMSAGAQSRPFLLTADQAAERVERCLRTRPRRYTCPRRMAALLWLVRIFGWGGR